MLFNDVINRQYYQQSYKQDQQKKKSMDTPSTTQQQSQRQLSTTQEESKQDTHTTIDDVLKENHFRFIPTMIDILSRVQHITEETENYHLYIKLVKLHEDMRQSLEVLNMLPGTNLTRQQQEEQYKHLQQLLDEKT